MTLKDRYQHVESTVQAACDACGRDRSEVLLIGVSKTVDVDAVQEAIEAGIHNFGENRPSELERKHDAFPDENWHFIGNIQSRQLSHVVGRAVLIHSLFEQGHADKIDRLAAEQGIVQDVLIEVNDGEDNKQGLDAKNLPAMLEHCSKLPNVRVKGLMIMAPNSDEDTARATFKSLAQLRDDMKSFVEGLHSSNIELNELSMGMTNDYPQAIAEGATMVRVGRAIFSESL